MKKILILLFIIFSIQIAYSQQIDTLIVQGNKAYTIGNYQQAVEKYKQVLAQGFISSELYYNLGNSYYKMNLLAPSVLNYERALLLTPSDEDILYNLELVNQLVVDKLEYLPEFFMKRWMQSFASLFSSDIWAIVSMVSFIVFLIFLSIFLYTRSVGMKKMMFWLAFIFIIISSTSFLTSKKQLNKIINPENAIVFTSSITVKSSPNQSGTDLFVLHEGTKVGIKSIDGDWTEIKLSDGSVGWLKSSDIVPI